MATELAMAMRRLKAQEAQARELAELNRKMDLVMAHLGIESKEHVSKAVEATADEAPAPTTTESTAEEVPAVVETKAKKK